MAISPALVRASGGQAPRIGLHHGVYRESPARLQPTAAQFRADRQPAATRIRRPKRKGDIHRSLQAKFAASFVLPTPLYCATCGYEQIGRVMFTRLSLTRDAIN
jgi:hypothetical protein